MNRWIVTLGVLMAAGYAISAPNQFGLGGGGGDASSTPNLLDYSRSGCSTQIGCASPTGGAWLIDPGIFDSSPGGINDPDGASFTYEAGAINEVGESFQTTPSALTIDAGMTVANCGTAAWGDEQFCTTLTNVFADGLTNDGDFCRDSSTYEACTVNGAGTCTSIIAGADDPETYIVNNQGTYSAIYVTAYSGCNSATNTITMQPAHAAGTYKAFGPGSTMMRAMANRYHPSEYYVAMMAQYLANVTVPEAYYPHNNLWAAWGGFDADVTSTNEQKCDMLTNTSGTNALTYAPTEAAYLGSWSSVRGTGCKEAVTTLLTPAVTVQPGAWYGFRIKLGSHGTGAAPTIQFLNGGGTSLDSYLIVSNGGYAWYDGLQTLHTLPQNAIASWTTLSGEVFIPQSAAGSTLRLEMAFGDATANYLDDGWLWPSIDDGGNRPIPPYMIPSGNHRFLVATDSRGLQGATQLIERLQTAFSGRADIVADFVDYRMSGRSLGVPDDSSTCSATQDISAWNSAANRVACNRGHDYAIMWHGVNDYYPFGTDVGPSSMTMRVRAAMRTFIAAGVTPLWFVEQPMVGNTTAVSPNLACVSDAGVSTNCSTVIEQFNRMLIYGGAWN